MSGRRRNASKGEEKWKEVEGNSGGPRTSGKETASRKGELPTDLNTLEVKQDVTVSALHGYEVEVDIDLFQSLSVERCGRKRTKLRRGGGENAAPLSAS